MYPHEHEVHLTEAQAKRLVQGFKIRVNPKVSPANTKLFLLRSQHNKHVKALEKGKMYVLQFDPKQAKHHVMHAGGIFDSIGSFFSDVGNKIKDTAVSAFNTVKDGFEDHLINPIKNLVTEDDFLKDFSVGLVQGLRGVQSVVDYVTPYTNQLPGALGKASQVVQKLSQIEHKAQELLKYEDPKIQKNIQMLPKKDQQLIANLQKSQTIPQVAINRLKNVYLGKGFPFKSREHARKTGQKLMKDMLAGRLDKYNKLKKD